ncbi:MAG: 4-(cytidine 5'-diphospho)-2-C-methyl-D-erythritol kinase [Candidatus Dormibacteria bacterium]
MKHRLAAPAKVNLGLEVVGRRPDGLHRLVSIIVNVALADEVVLEPGFGLRMSGPYAPAQKLDPASELATRALRLLEVEAGRPLSLSVAIEKRIPMGAGLGGGSADAAAVLRAAPALGVELPPGRAEEMALQLGADVPFQLLGGAALVRGVGEQLQPLPVPEAWMALVFPGIPISTAAVFGELRTDEWGDGAVIEAAARFLKDGGGPGALARLPNTLLGPALRLHPELGGVIASLRRAGWDPRMSGSGSTLYQVCFDRAEAEALAVRTWDLGLRAWAVPAVGAPGPSSQ